MVTLRTIFGYCVWHTPVQIQVLILSKTAKFTQSCFFLNVFRDILYFFGLAKKINVKGKSSKSFWLLYLTLNCLIQDICFHCKSLPPFESNLSACKVASWTASCTDCSTFWNTPSGSSPARRISKPLWSIVVAAILPFWKKMTFINIKQADTFVINWQNSDPRQTHILTSTSSDVWISLTHEVRAYSIVAGSTLTIARACAALMKVSQIWGTTGLGLAQRYSTSQFHFTQTPHDCLTREGPCQI